MAFLSPAAAPAEAPSEGQPYVDPFELHKPARAGSEADGGEGGAAFWGQCCGGGWCGGFDYLLVTPRLSNDRAFQTLTATTTTQLSTQSLHDVNFQYDYDSDYHVFIGYKRDCEELRFGFWHIQADDNEVGTASGNFAGGAGTQVQGFGTTPLTVAGQSVFAASHILMNMYDIDDLHKIEIPSNIDLNWFWGVRGVDYHRSYDALSPFETVNSDTTFAGVGPRVGVEGRRQIGCSHFSIYFAADVGVMLGHFKNDGSDLQPGVLQNTLDQYSTDDMRKIENIEMALAISWQPNCCTTVTAGWLFEDFSNMGNSGVPTSVCATCAGLVEASGAGQEVSFTGLFVRAEHCF